MQNNKLQNILEDEWSLAIEAKRAIAYLQCHRNYRYVMFLARGSYGWVSLAYDDDEQRALAVKCTQETSEMELSWWPKLQHPNIIPLLESITLDNCTVYVMPAMRKDILKCINENFFYKDEGSFSLCRIWLRDLATALDYLHKQYLCHLDLKLDNLLLKEDGHICLGDFCLLSDTREVPDDFNFLAINETPEYSTETLPSIKDFGGDKADMWQFGILAIDLLTESTLSGARSFPFSAFHHDIWPFVEKIIKHQDYFEYLLEKTFYNVVFNELDFLSCHDFVGKILCLDPTKRISAEQAMAHELLEVDWPQLPRVFSIPNIKYPESKLKDKIKEKQLQETPKERIKNSKKTPSKAALDVLKKKMKKIQKEKLIRRAAIAADSGKEEVKIKENVSTIRSSEIGIDRRPYEDMQEAEPKRSDSTALKIKASKTKSLSVIPSTIAKNKKLVAKVIPNESSSLASLGDFRIKKFQEKYSDTGAVKPESEPKTRSPKKIKKKSKGKKSLQKLKSDADARQLKPLTSSKIVEKVPQSKKTSVNRPNASMDVTKTSSSKLNSLKSDSSTKRHWRP